MICSPLLPTMVRHTVCVPAAKEWDAVGPVEVVPSPKSH